MLYTVKEVSDLSGVTVKTLHHYHKIGLLLPCEVSEAGYRLYGVKELERLQQILFFRELEIPLKEIERLLGEEPERLSILSQQEDLLLLRKQRLDAILRTLRQSISSMGEGIPMETADMFKGFESEEEWRKGLAEQNQYLKEAYGYDLLDSAEINVEEMNEQAAEAAAFMYGMARALRKGVMHNDGEVHRLIGSHLAFLNKQGHAAAPADFVLQTRFFLSDPFHLRMLEDQQTGLAYYLAAGAEAYAAKEPSS
ncbi:MULTISPECIES: MerR family transcriptional regulator [Paenibacillus]|uniref:MerR family transcriptional regulator n=1 Tax=Paenibacillus TaxID=44249 RepID=UPI0022B8EA4B|nr:MerR family transcriptional regulator [Paenibacillus caseinilyticus]MCZ8518533.1 MerR family transcriptional regulator [Paenibacillus caseinilyticus]